MTSIERLLYVTALTQLFALAFCGLVAISAVVRDWWGDNEEPYRRRSEEAPLQKGKRE